MLDNPAGSAAGADTPKDIVQRQLAAAFELPEADAFSADPTLAEIISASPRFVNSVDFMEACAKVANGFRKSHGASIRLPATSLDARISVIVDSFAEQLGAAAPAATGVAS